MLIRENPVSRQYHQIYFTFSIAEMSKIFQDVIDQKGIKEKDLKRKNKLIIQLVMDKIEEEIIEEEIDKLDIIAVCSKKYRYLTNVSPNEPLLLLCQFCILPPDIQLRFPTKIPNEILNIPYINEVVEDFTNRVLVMQNEYEEIEVKKAAKDCTVIYDLDYVQGDFKLSSIKDNKIDLKDEKEEQRDLFINSEIGDVIKLDESDNVNVVAIVKKILKKIVKKIDDDVVKKINFFNTKTVEEFRNKVKDIFTFSTNTVVLINYLTEFVIQTGEIEFDDYVINHFLDTQFVPKKKKEIDSYISEVKREIVKEYIILIINLNYMDDEPKFMNRINEEYEFDKILFNNPKRVDSYQEYVEHRIFETRVLEYCLDNNIIEMKL